MSSLAEHDASMEASFATIATEFNLPKAPYVATMNVAVSTDFKASSLTVLRESVATAPSAMASKTFRNCIIVKVGK